MNGRFYQQQPYSQNVWQQPYTQSIQYSSYQPMQTQPTHLTPYEYFAKPIQPTFEASTTFSNQQTNGALDSITGSSEQIDFDKLLSSIGQIASTYHQVSPIVKQLSSLIKLMR